MFTQFMVWLFCKYVFPTGARLETGTIGKRYYNRGIFHAEIFLRNDCNWHTYMLVSFFNHNGRRIDIWQKTIDYIPTWGKSKSKYSNTVLDFIWSYLCGRVEKGSAYSIIVYKCGHLDIHFHHSMEAAQEIANLPSCRLHK